MCPLMQILAEPPLHGNFKSGLHNKSPPNHAVVSMAELDLDVIPVS